MRFLLGNPDFCIGGYSSHSLKLAGELRRRGHWVCLLVLSPVGVLAEEFRGNCDRLIVVARRLEGRRSYLARIVEAELSCEPEVVINNEVPFVQASFPWLHGRAVTCCVMHSIRDEELDVCASLPECTDFVIGVSANTTSRLRTRLPPAQVAEVPVGVTLPAAARPAARPAAIQLVYVGRVARQEKNLAALEAVVRGLQQRKIAFRLTVIGDGNYRKTMADHLRPAVERGEVVFLGARSPAAAAALLPAFDVLVLTSLVEGTPHAVLEAMAAGVVPVCSRVSGATDRIVRDGETGYLCGVNAIEEFCHAIETLSLRRDRLATMSEAARQDVVARYSLPLVADRYLDLVREARGRRAGGRGPVRLRPWPRSLRGGCHSYFRALRARGGDVWRRLKGEYVDVRAQVLPSECH
jgi:glycosyltransferase involved in cell wall biosynthesis